MTEWLAYCAKGHKASAALSLTLRGEEFSEVKEHPWLEGDEVFLVNPDALRDPPEMPWEPLGPSPDVLLRDWWRPELQEFAAAKFPPPWTGLISGI